ncbi:MAG: type II toxin-antitoxin system RelE/ParE family toxin [Helicobacteraceae bacterium]|nr:type II toxin-antitoxin system RelE/ParE family toxin [Helicobacteraceae bacterium]
MDGAIWELRVQYASDIARIFYFAAEAKKLILLYGFVKKTQKTPVGEMERAKRCYDDYQRRK